MNTPRIDKVALLNQLRLCSLTDLKNLCFYLESEQPELRLFYDNLAGDTLEDKARELILHLQKYERLSSWSLLREVIETHLPFMQVAFLPTRAELTALTPPSAAEIPTSVIKEAAVQPSPTSSPPIMLDIEWVEIPAGEFWMGVDEGLLANVHRHTLPTFWITKTPITNAQYALFVQDTGHTPPEHWKKGRIPVGKEKHPVVFVSWHDAIAFSAWVTKQIGLSVSLPSEAEWEKAARGTDKRNYPWGNEFDGDKCHVSTSLFTPLTDTAPVDAYPDGASPYGVLDMAGNVYEWTRSKWGTGWTYQFGPPYDAEDGRENYDDIPNDMRFVVRGGSWDMTKIVATVYVRDGLDLNCKDHRTGFRLVMSRNIG